MIRKSILDLAVAVEESNWAEYWRAIPTEIRASIVRSHFTTGARPVRRRLVADLIIRNGGGFSFQKLTSSSDEELAKHASRVTRPHPDFIKSLIVDFYMNGKPEIQRLFFANTGNEEAYEASGVLIAENPGTIDAKVTRQGFDLIVNTFDELGLLYAIALGIGYADKWAGISDVVHAWAAVQAQGPASATPVPDQADETVELKEPAGARDTDPISSEADSAGRSLVKQPPRRLGPAREDRLTLLDDVLTKQILLSWAKGEHGLSKEELYALLEELLKLNTERRRTNYHLGFADALFGEPMRESLLQSSDERKAWYAAGYLLGLLRRNDEDRFVDILSKSEYCNILLSKPWAPLATVGEAVLDVLVRAGRYDDMVRLARNVVDASPSALRLVAAQGKAALLRHDPGTAYALLEPAVTMAQPRIDSMPLGDNRDRLSALQREMRRRLAHSCRLMGRIRDAREEIEDLLLDPALEPDVRSMLLTDLGLMESGYKELADLYLPDSTADFADVVANLEKGSGNFNEAVAVPDADVAHASYVLGMIHLLRSHYPEGAQLLRGALNAFEARPEVYTDKGLLRRVRLYTAIAELHEIRDSETGRRSVKRLVELIDGGVRPPTSFVKSSIEAALLSDIDAGEALIRSMLERELLDSRILLAIEGSSASEHLTSARVAASRDESRTMSERVALAYAALQGVARHQDKDTLAEMLAIIEDGAADRIMPDKFFAMIESERDVWEQCWDYVDAMWSSARVAYACGELERALAYAQNGFFSAVGSKRSHDWFGAAIDLLELMQCCGMSGADATKLHDLHLHRETMSDDCVTTFRPLARHRILVVGGNETQARYDDDVKATIAAQYGDHITVDFIHTGWTSNWKKHLDDVSRRLPQVDAVVISRMIRTTFGFQVRRRLAGRPWRLCGATGKGRLKDLIIELAEELEKTQSK